MEQAYLLARKWMTAEYRSSSWLFLYLQVCSVAVVRLFVCGYHIIHHVERSVKESDGGERRKEDLHIHT